MGWLILLSPCFLWYTFIYLLKFICINCLNNQTSSLSLCTYFGWTLMSIPASSTSTYLNLFWLILPSSLPSSVFTSTDLSSYFPLAFILQDSRPDKTVNRVIALNVWSSLTLTLRTWLILLLSRSICHNFIYFHNFIIIHYLVMQIGCNSLFYILRRPGRVLISSNFLDLLQV